MQSNTNSKMHGSMKWILGVANENYFKRNQQWFTKYPVFVQVL